MKICKASKYLIILACVVFAAWLTGLFFFVTTVNQYSEPVIDSALQPTEAIVVLTGGSERLATGIQLLASEKGRKLLVSGVPSGLSAGSVLAKMFVSQEQRDCCVVLGHTADNTIGNAEETLAWMKSENFKSLRLVTANYHMPRSLMIFQKTMPDMEIISHPISPDSVKLEDWWQRVGTARLLISEYNKFLFASVYVKLGLLP